MANSKKNWLSQLFDLFRSSNKKSGYKSQPLRLEQLEQRAMLNVAPVMTLESTSYDITSYTPWYIPLTSTDADGDAVFYKVEVIQNSNLTCDLSVGTAWKTGMSSAQKQAALDSRNPYWELTVKQEGNDILNGEDSKMLFELFADKAPNTVENILFLAEQDINFTDGHTEKFYENSVFHRVIEGFMSQGGGYDVYGNFRGSLADNVADEFHKDLQMNSPGVLAMANTGYKDTGSSQFFVTSGRCNWLNFKHSVFGFLIDGQEVQEEINKQGTNANSTPDPSVVIVGAEQVVNYTNSTLTVRANSVSGTDSTAKIRVTPYDINGMAGTSQVITLNIKAEQQTPVFYPIESDYAFVVQGNNYTQTYAAGFATGERLGYYSQLFYLKYDDEGKGTFTPIPNAVTTNYDTGEVTVNCADFSMGDYYLAVYALKYNSAHTISDDSILAALNVPIVIGPESVPAPTSVGLAVSDDTGVIGDGYTSVNSGTKFTVEGASSQWETEVYAGQYYLGSGVAAEGTTTVDVASQQYDSTTQTYSPLYFGYGSFDIVAVNSWYCPYWDNAKQKWAWASKTSAPTSVFELNTVLDTPENLNASAIAATSFNVSWSAVENADSYYLEFRKKGAENWTGGLWQDESTPTSCSMTDLAPNTVYEVRVSAYLSTNEASLSLPSGVIEVQTLGKLDAPGNLWAEINGSTITAAWNPVENAAGYQAYYRPVGEEQWTTVEEILTQPSIEIALDSAPEGLYEVAVVALAAEGSSTESSDGAVTLTTTNNLQFLSASMTTWKDRQTGEAATNVNEWQPLNLQVSTPAEFADKEGLKLVFQYDITLFVPDWANSEFSEVVEFSYNDVLVDDSATIREVTLIMAVLDQSKLQDGLVANIKMVPASPAVFADQAGVKLTDEKRDMTVTVFADDAKTAAEATTLNAEVWAVPYDLDDSGAVDAQDFVLFATYYGYNVNPADKNMTYYCDFNKSGAVDSQDFVLFATYYGMSYVKDGSSIAFATQDNAVNSSPAQQALLEAVEQEPIIAQSADLKPASAVLIEDKPVASFAAPAPALFGYAEINHNNVIQVPGIDNPLDEAENNGSRAQSSDNAELESAQLLSPAAPATEASVNSDPLSSKNVDLFFDLELFTDDDYSDSEEEPGEVSLPSLPN